MGKELTDAVLLRVMAEELSPSGMVRVFGWCVVYSAARSRPRSSAGADCVITLVEMRSAPASA